MENDPINELDEEEAEAVAENAGKDCKTNDSAGAGKGVYLAAAVVLAAALGAAGTLVVQRLSGQSAVNTAEADMDVGGRISDRVEDVNDAVSENAVLLRDTKAMVEAGNDHYEEIKNSLETIRENLSDYEEEDSAQLSEETTEGSDAIRTEDTEGTVSADLSYQDQEYISDTIHTILEDVDDLVEKVDSSSKETGALLEEVEKEEKSDKESIEKILDSYYTSIGKKNEEIDNSLTDLENTMTGTIDTLRKTEGNQYDNIINLLDKSEKELTEKVDANFENLETVIDSGKTQLTDTINAGVNTMSGRLSEDAGYIEEQLLDMKEDDAAAGKDILASIDDLSAKQQEELDNMQESISALSGDGGYLEDIRADSEQLLKGQNELAARSLDTMDRLNVTYDALSDQSDDLIKIKESLQMMEEEINDLAEGINENEALMKEHEALRSVLAEYGIEMEENASADEYCEAIRLLADKNSDEQSSDGGQSGDDGQTDTDDRNDDSEQTDTGGQGDAGGQLDDETQTGADD